MTRLRWNEPINTRFWNIFLTERLNVSTFVSILSAWIRNAVQFRISPADKKQITSLFVKTESCSIKICQKKNFRKNILFLSNSSLPTLSLYRHRGDMAKDQNFLGFPSDFFSLTTSFPVLRLVLSKLSLLYLHINKMVRCSRICIKSPFASTKYPHENTLKVGIIKLMWWN